MFGVNTISSQLFIFCIQGKNRRACAKFPTLPNFTGVFLLTYPKKTRNTKMKKCILKTKLKTDRWLTFKQFQDLADTDSTPLPAPSFGVG